MKLEHVRRHFRDNHATEEEKKKAKADREAKRGESSQRQIRQSLNFLARKLLSFNLKTHLSEFLANRHLSPAQISELREMNLRVVSTTHIPLSFFSKDIVKGRDRKLLEICGFDPNEVDKFDKSPDALKYDARKISEEHRNIIRVTARQVAEKGQYAISVDHKATLNTKGDPEAHSCGVVLIRTQENFQRTFYLLDYVPASETNVEATVDLVREVLEVRNFLFDSSIFYYESSTYIFFFQRYNLFALVKEGLISMVGDSKIVPAAKKLAPKAMVEYCGMHDIGRFLRQAQVL